MENIYCVSVKGKKRYIVPLVKTSKGSARITDIDLSCKEAVEQYEKLKRAKYVGFNFKFKPYSFEDVKE